jgi:3-hydroxyisobutyrate dehydrogenase
VRRRIAFYGIGTMGAAMAGRLYGAGHAVSVHDLVASRVDEWRRRFPDSPNDADGATVIITCVTDDAAVTALLLGDRGLIRHCRPGTQFVDHTTASAATARRIAEAARAAGATAVDAPASGGRHGAEAGQLSIMMGGSDEAAADAASIVGCYAARITHLGPPGAGQVAKFANQIAIAGIVRGLAEAVALARADGLAPATLLAALSAGSAQSAQLERLSGELVDAGRSFAALGGWLTKDLKLALAEGRRLGTPLPMTAVIADLLALP